MKFHSLAFLSACAAIDVIPPEVEPRVLVVGPASMKIEPRPEPAEYYGITCSSSDYPSMTLEVGRKKGYRAPSSIPKDRRLAKRMGFIRH